MKSILKTVSLGNPIEFKEHIFIDNLEIKYVDLMEVNQGSPVVGKLLINKNLFSEECLFGGPFLYENKILYIPLFIRRFCVVGFKLARINCNDFSISYLSKIEDLIYLKEIRDNKIFYFVDIYKNEEKFILLP
ncbi:hypothetical protein [Neisseria zoodegmatis]|uniref:Uncharacterized protein n=1 Tax=Neisseria zoodegmatis TaxID=326523 RepID=A0AB38DSP7_9NEIS|nr:hypothetical protein [Neisseria zoodegmatis]OSI11024.1 hypothetical protein BWD10_03660 [Neisseria zoodegmatis]SNU80259.1 Uncharacterised protein [Neisseria zoodegmatis]